METRDQTIPQTLRFSIPYHQIHFICCNMPSAPVYGVFLSKLIRYAIACRNYENISYRAKFLTIRFQTQGYVATRLVISTEYVSFSVSICVMRTGFLIVICFLFFFCRFFLFRYSSLTLSILFAHLMFSFTESYHS